LTSNDNTHIESCRSEKDPAELSAQKLRGAHTPRTDDLILKWAESFVLAVPTLYDKNGTWWSWNFDAYQYEETDETELLNGLRHGHDFLGDNLLRQKRLFVTALELVARERKPPELPACMIQFKETIYNIDTGETRDILKEDGMPKFFTTNAVPHKIGETEDTPTLDYLFSSWVGKENVQTLYELVAYCCYRAYPIHIIAVLNGSGRNGKGSFLKILKTFLGENNLASTDLDLLSNNRFETYNIFRKLGALMTETNFDVLKKTSVIKALSGDDLIRYEKKGHTTINEYSYAKLLIATNSLPQSEDNTDGFFRRWLILDFPNQFELGKDVTLSIPKEEYENLAKKVTRILPELLERGRFTGQGTVAEQKQKYIETSNPFKTFVEKYCLEHTDAYVSYGLFSNKYFSFCEQNRFRRPSWKAFKKSLEEEGFFVEKTTRDGDNGRFVFGVKLKDTVPDFAKQVKSDGSDGSDAIPTYPSYTRVESSIRHNGHNGHTAPLLPDFPSPSDVLENLNALGGRVTHTQLTELFPHTELTEQLHLLKRRGDIMESQPFVYQVVK